MNAVGFQYIENNFGIITDDQINSFLEIVADSYSDYIKRTGADEIPLVDTIMESELADVNHSMLHDFIDDNYAWMLFGQEPETYPEPYTKEWQDNGYDARVQEILYDGWNDGIREDYIHEIEEALLLLQMTFISNKTKQVVNSVVCEVW